MININKNFSPARFASAGSALVSGNILNLLILFGEGILLARVLGPTQFGLYSTAIAAGLLAAGLLGFRTADGVTRSLVLEREHGRTERLRLTIAAGLVCDLVSFGLAFLVVIALSDWLALKATGTTDMSTLFVLAAFSVFLGFAMNTFMAVARDRRHFALIGFLIPAIRMAEITAMAALAVAGKLTVWTAVIVIAVRSGVGLVIILLYLLRQWQFCYPSGLPFRADFNLIGRRSELRSFWRFMAASFVWSVATALPKSADIVILGLFRSPEECGYYRLAKNLVGVGQSLAASLSSLIYREFLEMVGQQRWTEAKLFSRRLAAFLVPAAVIGSLVVGVLGPWIITLIYGSEYGAAVLPMRIMLFGGAMVVAGFWGQGLILALGLIRFNAIVLTALSFVATAAYLPLSFAFGIAGAAAVSSVFWATTQGVILTKGLRELSSREGP